MKTRSVEEIEERIMDKAKELLRRYEEYTRKGEETLYGSMCEKELTNIQMNLNLFLKDYKELWSRLEKITDAMQYCFRFYYLKGIIVDWKPKK
jgi:hypothetical protein